MEAQFIPVTVLDVIDMLISGKEKLATELVKELQQSSANRRKRNR